MSNWGYRLTRAGARVVSAPFVSLRVWRRPGALEVVGGAVVVSNHISHFDPGFLTVAFARNIDWMTSAEFYVSRFAATWLSAVDAFPVDRARPDQRALRVGVERLRAGRLVGMFPEGGIRAGPTSILGGVPPKRGASALARLANVPIVPCVIFGSDRLYATQCWRPIPPRTPVWLTIGPSLSVAGLGDDEANARLAEALREIGAAMTAHFSLGPDDLPATPQHRKGRDAQSSA